MEKGKLNIYAFALSLSILSGMAVFSGMVVIQLFLHGKPLVAGIGTVYMSYDPSAMSSVYGGVIAGIYGFLGGFAFAWLYNKVAEYF